MVSFGQILNEIFVDFHKSFSLEMVHIRKLISKTKAASSVMNQGELRTVSIMLVDFCNSISIYVSDF